MNHSSVNLLWQRRHRGLIPASGHNVGDEGYALLIRPDELERRTYQVFCLAPGGEARELCAIAVETISKFDVRPDGRLLVGLTTDDLYIFRDARKVRFAPDQRALYSDACLATGADWFVCGYSDGLGASQGMAVGDANGRIGWNKDLGSPVNRVAISGDGAAVVAGLQSGRLLALDIRRNPLWECVQGEPVSALAMPGTGSRCLAGTQVGTVLSIDEDGGFAWRSSMGLPVIALATDAAGRWTAAVVSDAKTHLLACLGPNGDVVWEHDLEARPTGVSLSPNGKYLLVTLANGSASMFEVDFSAVAASGGRGSGDAEAVTAWIEAGDLARAHEALAAQLRAAPHEVETAAQLAAVEKDLLARYREEARGQAEQGLFREALETLERAFQLDPWDSELFQQRREYRDQAVQNCAQRARMLDGWQDWDGATRAWQEALALDPGFTEGREALQRMRQSQAEELMQAGDARQAAGDVLNAVALWQQAQRLAPSEELQERLRQAEVARCVAAGVTYYEAQRMPEAVFQLKKALALDPDNEQAERYLRYAQGMSEGNLISDRFSRLE